MTTRLLTVPRLRRWALVLGSLLGASAAAQAQTLNYGTANATNVAGTFTDLGTTGTVISTTSTDDANSAAQAIGFTFGYNGATFTQFVLNTNGLIRLGSAAPSAANMFAQYEGGALVGIDPIGSTAAADVNLLAPFNTDLQSGTATAEYRVATTGTTGSRVCTIQWKNVSDKADASPTQYANFTFQLKLYETSNRIEFVYGTATAGTGTSTARFPTVGIKGSGSASGQDVLVNKTASTAAWSTSVFISGVYGSSTHNYRSTVGPDAGRTYRFDAAAASDAAVAMIYTYGKLATPTALPHAVQAVISNVGSAALTSLPVTLNVTGANTFTDTKTIATLAAGASTTVTFASYPATLAQGTNTVTVTLPADGNTANNTATYGQQVTANRISYIDPAGTLNATGIGVGQAGGALVAKYTLPAATTLNDVALTFAASAGNVSTYQVVIYDATGTGGTPGTVLYTSATQTRTALASTATITLPSVAVPANFFIGVKELDTNPALAYQVEDPLKPATYYYSLDAATGWTLVNSTTLRTRLAIEFGAGTVACAAPTALAVGSVTATTASVTFTAASGATNYTLTYTPAGGTTQTRTVTGSPVSLTGLTPGTTYTVTLATNCTGSTSVAATATFTTPLVAPANNECAGAITLTPGATCVPTNGTTVGATQSLAAITCATFTGNADDDVWYKFVATSTGHTVTVVGGANLDAVVDVRSGNCTTSTNIGCADATAAGGTETVVLTGLTPSATYYVRVYGYGDAPASSDAFTICVTNSASCATPTDLAIAALTPTAAQFTFTPSSGVASYIVTYTPTGGTTTTLAPAPTASPFNLTGLTPGTTYTLTFQASCSAGGTGTAVSGTFTTPTANDDPTGAIALTVSATCTPTNGTNAGATTTTANGYTNPGTCGIAVNPKDVWYTFTTLAGQSAATITVTGAPAGLVRVFSAASSAGPFTQVNCSAGSTNNTVAPALTLTGLTPSTTYYISVAGYGSGDTQGAFTICVTGTACPAPTALTATAITTTGTTLTFTPATGATNYTVTYTPTGGTAQTVTATGSPVTLTGLTPNTTYAVRIVTNCSASQTSAAATTTFTTLAPCVAVTALTAGSITTTGATLTFTPPTGNASSYTVTYRLANGTGTPTTITATGSPVVLTGLTPSTAYTVSIVTNCSASQTSAAATVDFTTLTPCVAVTNLAAGSITTTSASITFAPAAAGTSYTITYTPAGGTAQTQTATGSPVTLAGLTPSTQYTVSVVTSCGGGQTSPSASITFTTLTPCTAITALAAGSITTTGATLTFTAPAAGATSYTVTYTPTGGTAQTVTATGSPTILTGLTPSTTYTVSVVTNCGGGQTSAAATTTFTTLTPCTAVTALAATNVATTTATLTFTPAAAGTSYTITYTPAGGTAQTQTATGSPVNLVGLLAGKQYTVSIVTSCGAGQTSTAATTTFTTLAPAPTNVAASNVTATGASIGFTAATGATTYTVTYTPTGGTAQTVTVTGSPAVLTGLTAQTTYAVTVVANYPGGSVSSAATTTFTTPQGLATHAALASGVLEVYPNPAHHSFTVSLPALGTARTAQLELINALGQIISQQTIALTAGGTRTPVDATTLATGIYSVRVRAGGETAIIRLAIE